MSNRSRLLPKYLSKAGVSTRTSRSNICVFCSSCWSVASAYYIACAVDLCRILGADKSFLDEMFILPSRLKAIADQMRRIFLHRAGVTEQQMVCLILSGHCFGRCHNQISGYAGPWQHNPGRFNNMMAVNLLTHKWKLMDKNMVRLF